MAKKSQLGITGRIGEQLAKRYLINEGYDVVVENVTYPYGEIDLVAYKDDVYYFVEVKAADVRSKMSVALSERLGPQKLARVKKATQSYIAQNDLYNYEVAIFAILVKIDSENKKSWIKVIQDLGV